MNDKQAEKMLYEALKKYSKRPEDVKTEAEAAAMEYFTDDKLKEMAKGLIDILKQDKE